MEPKSRYDFNDTEDKWYGYWLRHGYFHAKPDKSRKPFTIVIPPPNITGSLHMGHALNNVLQDVIIRLKRMQGYETLWLPGTDHGGIATQNIVEKELKKEGVTREALGREKFLERMWQWRKSTGDTILQQLKKLGCSCDWERTRFTMDEGCARAVYEAFKKLYEAGLIYRGEYIVNWCPGCNTALSDIEVEYEELKGKLWHIRYPAGSFDVVVATTRPETMLGDTAVAVNPKDARYKDVAGKNVTLPVMNREIPVITDDFVDPEFGTGAVKVTPFHDPDDFEMGRRHKLAGIKVIDEKGRMTGNAGKYAGKDRYECRKELLEELSASGYLVKVEAYNTSVGHCYRCNTVIEPLVSKQWFLKMKDMAGMGMEVVHDGRVKFVPGRWKNPYMNWLENLHDWCISRQIWWGHQLPVWYCVDSNANRPDKCRPVISQDMPVKCPDCGNNKFVQDPDVLDTWFSSGLWPFSTLGWPEETEDLNYFYPTSVLVTGHEILYLWVARMIMMGMMLRKNIPYGTVYINGIVRDAKGKKMSKSYGNVIDPLEVTSKYGTDALRFCLCQVSIMGRDLQLSEENFEVARNFANKIWNASRFLMMNLNDYGYLDINNERLEDVDKWIIAELNKAVKDVTAAYEEYDISKAARLMYEFIWNKYCDYYIEFTKNRLAYPGRAKEKGIELEIEKLEKRKIMQNVHVEVLHGILKLIHPVMPFITEEIWQNLNKLTPGRQGLKQQPDSIMVSSWPQADEEKIDEEVINEVEFVIKIITAIRNIRSVMNVPQKTLINVEICSKPGEYEIITEYRDYIGLLTGSGHENKYGNNIVEKPPHSATAVVGGTTIYVPLEGIIDLEKEKARINNNLLKLRDRLGKIEKKLSNTEYTKNAPLEIVSKTESEARELKNEERALEEILKNL